MGIFPEKKYRITLVEDKTHEKIRSYRFSLTGVIILGVTVFVLLIAVLYSLIAFTPIRTTIPGYPDAYSKNRALENAIRIDSLESVIIKWELYADNLSRVLMGRQTINLDSLVSGNATKYLKQISAEHIQYQDSILRERQKAKIEAQKMAQEADIDADE